jgi:hypothetical protein
MSDVEKTPKAASSAGIRRLKSAVQEVRRRLAGFGSGSMWSWRLWFASLLVLFLLPVGWLWLVFRRVQNCPNIETASSFSSDPIRFVDYVTSHGKPGTLGCQLTSLGDLHENLAFGYVIALVNLLVFAVLWAMWWKRAWLTTRSVATRRLVWVAVIGAFADIVENIVQHASIGLPGSAGTPRTPNIGWFATRVLPIVAWVNVLSFAAVWLLLLFTLIAAFSRRRLHGQLADGVERGTAVPAGLGICCSGGGIRAASVSLGALGVLERTREDGSAIASCTGSDGILDQAKYLASVSGGGYTAGAWRIARGTAKKAPTPAEFAALWPSGVIGAPDDYDDVPPVAFDDPASEIGRPSLFRHLQQRREFLRTGRGGFSASLFTAVGLLAIHLFLLLGLLLAIAWPIGRLSSTSYVYGGIGCKVDAVIAADGHTVRASDQTILDLSRHGDLPASLCTKSVALTVGDELMRHSPTRARVFVTEPGRQFPITWRLYGPAAVFGGIAALLFAFSLGQWNSNRRARVRAAATGLAAVAVLTGGLLVVIPVLLDVVHPWLVSHATVGKLLALVSGGGAVAGTVGMVRKVLGPRLAMLGGVLLAFGAGLLGVEIAAEAAMGRKVFVVGRLGHDWWGWIVLVGLLCIGYMLLCPRWWSLHTLYRNRLRGAFATTRRRDWAPKRLRGKKHEDPQPLWPIKQRHEPLLDEYVGAPGPVHLICCSAARQSRAGTGVKALSFVMSPEEIVLYDVAPTSSGRADQRRKLGQQVPVQSYSASTRTWVQALGSKHAERAEGTVSAGMSVSGAAIAPAMGRMDKGTTMALLAALNLRLGTWYPNPRYLSKREKGRVRYPWVRLSYMLKELLGMYDLKDHHLYVTDGGHRENLGLVELLRRRCETIICVDASGDSPGSYGTLRQAADLARVEVGATIDLGPLRAWQTSFFSEADTTGTLPTWQTATTTGSVRVGSPRMTAPGTERPPSAHTVLDVTYKTPTGEVEGHGKIVHIAAVLYDSESFPDDLVAFSLQDPEFPHYSTSDQFLNEKQFRCLVQFGEAATAHALVDPAVIGAIRATLRPEPVAAKKKNRKTTTGSHGHESVPVDGATARDDTLVGPAGSS